jgi:microcompartment protein CcmK/EutM
VRIGRVVGKVVLSRWHPTMSGATYKIVVPMALEDLLSNKLGTVEDVVAYDELGAGAGAAVAISEGREAAQPFHPAEKPVDAYLAAILDWVTVEPLEKFLPSPDHLPEEIPTSK